MLPTIAFIAAFSPHILVIFTTNLCGYKNVINVTHLESCCNISLQLLIFCDLDCKTVAQLFCNLKMFLGYRFVFRFECFQIFGIGSGFRSDLNSDSDSNKTKIIVLEQFIGSGLVQGHAKLGLYMHDNVKLRNF